jgi:hypothetical protein
MGAVIMPNLGLSAVDQTLFNELSAPRIYPVCGNTGGLSESSG